MTFRVIISVIHNNEIILNPIIIQFVVAVTTALMVTRFVLDALRHRSRGNCMKMTLIIMDAVTQAMIMYSFGIMQRPSGTNSYYQVWAVLLVTLRYSVKIGRPAGIALKQTPLVDLMSSFWAANILRSQAMKILKVTGWLLWSVNSLRIIHGFLSSEFANDSHRENMRLLTDYMRHEHRAGGHGENMRPDPRTMKGYRYLVLGESKKQKMKKLEAGRQARDMDMAEETENIRRLVMALRDDDKKLVTLEKIWSERPQQQGRGHGSEARMGEGAGASTSEETNSAREGGGRRANPVQPGRTGRLAGSSGVLDEELKDLCLSFALYKLLRRRFFNFGIHEAKLERTRRLVLEGILGGVSSDPEVPDDLLFAKSKRAFRVSEAEVAFLNDFFNSRHAIIFANGFPIIRLVLSTVLLGCIAGMAAAIHRFSKVAKVDELGSVHHGVVFTWFLLSFLGAKEIWEITTYVLSDWTKVLVLCKLVETKPWWLRGPVAEALVRKFCKISLWRRWHGKVGQCNLLFPTSFLRKPRRSMYLVDLSDEVKRSVVDCLCYCLDKRRLDNYVGRALESLSLGSHSATGNRFRAIVSGAGEGVEGDVQTLLVWHIATCYCEIALGEARGVRVSRLSSAQGFAQRQEGEEEGALWSSYIIARTLSQYCAYVLRLAPPLVPGSSLMASSVREKVYKEKMDLFLRERERERCYSSTGILDMLREYASGDIHLYEEEEDDTILKKGADLGKKLVDATTGGGGGGDDVDGDVEAADSDLRLEAEHLWKFLSKFWAGFVIHLAASTRAYQHKIFLSSGGELMTHIWALLSHAGVLGAVEHGDQAIETAQTEGEVYDPSTQF